MERVGGLKEEEEDVEAAAAEMAETVGVENLVAAETVGEGAPVEDRDLGTREERTALERPMGGLG